MFEIGSTALWPVVQAGPMDWEEAAPSWEKGIGYWIDGCCGRRFPIRLYIVDGGVLRRPTVFIAFKTLL